MSTHPSCGPVAAPPSVANADLAALGQTLQQLAQALVTLASQGEAMPPNPDPMTSSPPEESPQPAEGEIRSYYFSPYAFHQEQTLLRQYRADTLLDLLTEAHSLLSGMSRLMRNVKQDAKMRGSVLISLGQLLDQVSTLLLRIRNVYGQAEQVEP